MDTVFMSALVVALAEIGDKTQLLSICLAARYRRPAPIIFGILIATLANHALAGAAGAWLRSALSPETLRWGLGISLLAMAAWTLKPDTLDDREPAAGRYGVFTVALIAFFLAEIGDKTQIATVMLAAQTPSLLAVVVGTTLGMMLANVPVVMLGSAFAQKIPLRAIRLGAACLFAVLGTWTLLRGIG